METNGLGPELLALGIAMFTSFLKDGDLVPTEFQLDGQAESYWATCKGWSDGPLIQGGKYPNKYCC